jgi:hypothetical protein
LRPTLLANNSSFKKQIAQQDFSRYSNQLPKQVNAKFQKDDAEERPRFNRTS